MRRSRSLLALNSTPLERHVSSETMTASTFTTSTPRDLSGRKYVARRSRTTTPSLRVPGSTMAQRLESVHFVDLSTFSMSASRKADIKENLNSPTFLFLKSLLSELRTLKESFSSLNKAMKSARSTSTKIDTL